MSDRTYLDFRSGFRSFWLSWIETLAADGDGIPNWLIPMFLLIAVVGMEAAGIYFATDRAAFIIATQKDFLIFVGADVTAWLGYSGWKAHKNVQKMALEVKAGEQPQP